MQIETIKKMTHDEAIELLINLSKTFDFKIENKSINQKTLNKSKSKNIKIYCDGGCRGNPGISGSGVIVFNGNQKLKYAGHFDSNGTNNTAELLALIEALKLSRDLNVKLTILTDSMYCINSMTKWAVTWKKNNWTKKGGIKNLELIQECFSLYSELESIVTLKYVKGHSGDIGNDAADELANYAMVKKVKGFKLIG